MRRGIGFEVSFHWGFFSKQVWVLKFMLVLIYARIDDVSIADTEMETVEVEDLLIFNRR